LLQGPTENQLAGTAPVVEADVYEIDVPFVVPYKMAHGTFASSSAVLVKLTDCDGFEGWGEANPSEAFSGETSSGVARLLRDSLLPLVMTLSRPHPGYVDAVLDRHIAGNNSAKGAISMALLDLLGKRVNLPAAALLGGALRDSLPVLWPLSNGAADDDREIIDQRAALGFTTFMVKMGSASPAHEIARLHQLYKHYGDRFQYIPDANQGWSRDDAREFVRGVKALPLAFFEQPVDKHDLDGMALVAAASSFPISADESLIDLADAASLAKEAAASVFSIKTSKNGGPLRAQAIASVAKAFDIRCYMNSMLEFGISQAASLQHAVTVGHLVDAGHAFMSTLRFAEDPTDFSSLIHQGVVHLPSTPGLGVGVDERHVERLAVGRYQLGANP